MINFLKTTNDPFLPTLVCTSVSTGRDVPLSLCPGTRTGANPSVPRQNHLPKATEEQEKDVEKQEEDVLKQERNF